MKFFKKMKDGGPESTVTGYWLVEMKSLFSIVLLKFDGRSRECFHNHAFNSLAWVLKGELQETMLFGNVRVHKPSFRPFLVTRDDFHKVDSTGTSWVFNIRGPWTKRWKEYLPSVGKFQTLVAGRKVIPNS
jgi:hypothetical protein